MGIRTGVREKYLQELDEPGNRDETFYVTRFANRIEKIKNMISPVTAE